MLINPTSDRSTGLHVHLSICPLVTYTWKSHRHHRFNTSTNGTNHFLPETFSPRVPYAITWHCHIVAQAANLGIASEPPSPSRSRSDRSKANPQTGKIHLQNIYLKQDSYLEYVKNAKFNKVTQFQFFLARGKRHEETSTERIYIWQISTHENFLHH